MACQLRALDRLARLRARNRGRVEQPQAVAEGRREPGERRHELDDLRRQRADALVVAGLTGDVGKEVAEAALGHAQEAALLGTVEEDLRDRQTDDLGVADPRTASTPSAALGQEIIGEHIKCGEQGVEVGWHAASLVGVAFATPDFDARPRAHARRMNSESTTSSLWTHWLTIGALQCQAL